jgi:hypothetical protein
MIESAAGSEIGPSPVVLVYLGFLGAQEMGLGAQAPFANPQAWISLVKKHSSTLFPEEIWNNQWDLHGQAFFPLIRSINCPLNVPIAGVIP